MACLTGTWSNTFSEQCEFIENMLQTMEDVDRETKSIVLHQITEPTENEMLAAWVEQSGIDDVPEVGTTFYWFSPTTQVIENVYFACEDAVGGSSGVPISYYTKDRSLDWVFIDEFYAENDTAVLSTTVSGLSQDYKHLFVTHSARAIDAGVSVVWGMRLNQISTASYHGTRTEFDAAAVVGANFTGQQSILQAAMLPGAGTTYLTNSAASGYAFITNYSVPDADRSTHQYIVWRYLSFIGTSPLTNANRNLISAFAFLATALGYPVTEITIIGPAVSFKRGTRITVWGLK